MTGPRVFRRRRQVDPKWFSVFEAGNQAQHTLCLPLFPDTFSGSKCSFNFWPITWHNCARYSLHHKLESIRACLLTNFWIGNCSLISGRWLLCKFVCLTGNRTRRSFASHWLLVPSLKVNMASILDIYLVNTYFGRSLKAFLTIYWPISGPASGSWFLLQLPFW